MRNTCLRATSALLCVAGLGGFVSAACSSTSASETPEVLANGSETDASESSSGPAGPGEPGQAGSSDIAPAEGPLVDLSLRHQPGTRLTPRFVKTADGARHFLGFRDQARGEDCEVKMATDGVSRCLPAVAPTLGKTFRDGACSSASEVFVSSAGPACSPKYALQPAGCSAGETRLGVTLVGPKLPNGTTLYRDAPCRAFGTAGSLEAFARGSVVDPSGFVGFSRVVSAPLGAVAIVDLVGEDGSRTFAGLVHAASGRACDVRLASDGQRRCLPVADAARLREAFRADAACTVPIYQGDTGGCAPPPAFTFTSPSRPAGVCESTYTMGTAGPPIVGTIHMAFSDGCSRVPATNLPGAVTSTGDLAPTTFALATEVDLATSRIRPRTYVVSPGIGARQGLVDSVRKEDCEPTVAADGALRCLPRSATARLFADAACTRPVVESQSLPVSACSSNYISYVEEGCPARTRVFSVGASKTIRVYARSITGCVAQGSTRDIREAGGEIAASSFEAFTAE